MTRHSTIFQLRRWPRRFKILTLALLELIIITCVLITTPSLSLSRTNSQGDDPALTTGQSFSALSPILATLPPTAIFPPGILDANQENPALAQARLLSDQPLRFIFPTPAPPPVSAWRPPLYPVPWALSPYDHFYFTRPIAADEVNWAEWDYRYGGKYFDDSIHTGIDIPVSNGKPVLAAGSGKVIWAGYGLYRGYYDRSDPYGQAVAIHHDFGYQSKSLYTVYGHLDQVDVARGQYVRAGDRLGFSGETGQVTGPHLHFEVRVGENDYFTTRNPELWLVPPQGWGVLAGRVMKTGGLLAVNQLVIVTSKASGQNWMAKSYSLGSINSDDYYQENLVISDLPAGLYNVRIPYAGMNFVLELEIRPGMVSYFTFRGYNGFNTDLPPKPGSDFIPVP